MHAEPFRRLAPLFFATGRFLPGEKSLQLGWLTENRRATLATRWSSPTDRAPPRVEMTSVSAFLNFSDVESALATFRRKMPFFRSRAREAAKAKPAKLGLAGL